MPAAAWLGWDCSDFHSLKGVTVPGAWRSSRYLFLRDCVECKKFERGALAAQQSCSRMCRDEIETVEELGKRGEPNPCPNGAGRLSLPVCIPLPWGALILSLWQVTGARML